MLAFIAIVLFGMYDYIGFNTIKNVTVYRISQYVVQTLLTIGCWYYGNWNTAVAFLILWWTFVGDLIYYFFYDVFKIFHKGYAGHAFDNEVLGNFVTWAWWTPYGLYNTFKRNSKKIPINGKILILQAIVGVAVASIFLLI
jgi:hypothetical protein